MSARDRFQVACLIGWKKILAARSNMLILAGLLAVLGLVWAKESFSSSFRLYLFLFPHIFLLLSQDMFRDEIASGALENVLFLGGEFRNYLLAKNVLVGSVSVSLCLMIFLGYGACALVRHEFSILLLGQFLAGIVVGVYYVSAAGLLSFFFRTGSNVLIILLGQVLFFIALLLSTTHKAGLLDLLSADSFQGIAARFKYFGLAVVLPNIIISRRPLFAVAGIAVSACLLLGVQKIIVRSLELEKT
jgi:hypothetical protein